MDDFISVDDLAAFMGKDDLDDDQAAFAVAAAQQVVRNYMQQEVTFHEDDVEYPHVPWGYRRFRLRQRPVRAVTEVRVDDQALDETTDWVLRNSTVVLTDAPWSAEVSVTYDHGWDAPGSETEDVPVPADIRRVALSVARRSYIGSLSADDEQPLRSETIGSYSYTTAASSSYSSPASGSSMTESEMETLDWYVIRLAV
jgi:hypothetical protein